MYLPQTKRTLHFLSTKNTHKKTRFLLTKGPCIFSEQKFTCRKNLVCIFPEQKKRHFCQNKLTMLFLRTKVSCIFSRMKSLSKMIILVLTFSSNGLICIYHIVPKFSDDKKLCYNLPKIKTKEPNFSIVRQKDVKRIADSVDPD